MYYIFEKVKTVVYNDEEKTSVIDTVISDNINDAITSYNNHLQYDKAVFHSYVQQENDFVDEVVNDDLSYRFTVNNISIEGKIKNVKSISDSLYGSNPI